MTKRICRAFAFIAAGILASSVTVQAVTINNGSMGIVATDSIQNWPQAPAVTSETAVLMNASTGAILYDKGMDDYRYPASTTKLMTILVSMENSSPKDQVTFTENGIRDVKWDSSNIAAQLGEVMSMRDCWEAAYIKSANEVCTQIAETTGGSEADFVNMMNQRAQELGCTNTHFTNANGLPDPEHYSTAHDMAKIMQQGLKSKRFRNLISKTDYTIKATNLSAARQMHTHMPMMAKESSLYYESCIGGKTGFTNDAKHTLVVAAERDGRTYIAVTMRTDDLGINCKDSISLFDYAFDNFESINVNGTLLSVPKGTTVNDLQAEAQNVNGTDMNSYSYNGQFVGYVPVAVATPEPTEAPAETADTETDAQTAEASGEEISDQETAGQEAEETEKETEKTGNFFSDLSQTSKILLGILGGMIVLLLILLFALHRKENK